MTYVASTAGQGGYGLAAFYLGRGEAEETPAVEGGFIVFGAVCFVAAACGVAAVLRPGAALLSLWRGGGRVEASTASCDRVTLQGKRERKAYKHCPFSLC